MSETIIAGGGDEQTLTTTWTKLGTKTIKTLHADKAVLYITYNPATDADTLHVYFKTGPDPSLVCQTTRKESALGVSTIHKEQFDYLENLGNANDDLIQIPIQLTDSLLEVWVKETTSGSHGKIDLAKVLLQTIGKE